MMPTFRLSIRLLDAAFHGRGDGGEPEWPPSPLRAFQALVNAAARRWPAAQFEGYAREALEWLERLGPPAVVAPPGRTATRPYRLYVPNNAGDLMVAAWARGDRSADMSGHRTEKDACPTRFAGADRRPLESNPDFLPIHFDWPLTPGEYEEGRSRHRGTLEAAARSISHLGWGVDMAVGHSEFLADDPTLDPAAELWTTDGSDDGSPLRVPVVGTLSKLVGKQEKFHDRLSGGGFKPVPPLTVYRVVGYRRAADPAARLRGVAFRIVSADPDDASPSFDAPRRTRDVAAWVRHAAGKVCADEPDVATFVHGHDPADDAKQVKGDEANARLLYLPLPTINPKLNRVEAIRRVLIAGPVGHYDRVRHVGRLLEGEELRFPSNLAGRPPDGGEPARNEEVKGVLAPLSSSDWVLEQYTRSARVWATVTPVILPGYDDRNPAKAEKLLRRAFVQTGLSEEVVADVVELAWRNVGFRPGVDLASQYCRPDHLTGPAYHVRVRFRHPVRGPLAVGAGRYRGFGVFAAEGD